VEGKLNFTGGNEKITHLFLKFPPRSGLNNVLRKVRKIHRKDYFKIEG